MTNQHDTEKVQEDFWKILQNVNEWIRFSDQKAVFVITTYSVILTLTYTNVDEISKAIGDSNFLISSSVLIAITSVASIFFSFKCLAPTLNNKNTSSIFFFGHIANHKTPDQYYSHSISILTNPRAIEDNLAEQIHTNSSIATKKFKMVSWSIRLQVVSILIMLLSLAIYFII